MEAELPTLGLLLRRDRIVTLAGLFVLSGLSWAYMVRMAAGMGSMKSCCMAALTQNWTAADLVMLFVMWAVMMVAMMVPTAAPMVLMFAAANRKKMEPRRPYVPTAIFLSGYLIVWTGFSLLATVAQWALHKAAWLSPQMASASPYFGGGLLIAAGIFQFTPLKHVCLRHCRTPIGFLMTNWREGARGALVMGLKHGAFCTGCCWFLMALLFVAGVMNVLWIAALTALVLVEKAVPRGDSIGRWAGAAMTLAGIALIVAGLHGGPPGAS